MKKIFPFLVCAALACGARAEVVAKWSFGQEETSKLTAIGGVHRDVPGPRPPEFPDFLPDNVAVKLDGKGSRYTFEDPGARSGFDFTNGDSISIEAWVNLADINDGENVYVIGKGRTKPGWNNQNWALRVREQEGTGRISFLFATPLEKDAAKDAQWHRWTTTSGFAADSGWHHLAVSYTFGEPASVRGWIDGKPVGGAWDMGGSTTVAPVVDDDDIWIGSAMGGSAGNSFRGSLDDIVVHRGVLTDDYVKSNARRVAKADENKPAPPATAPEMGAIPAGQVLVTFSEGAETSDMWPKPGAKPLVEVSRWLTPDFAVPRLPMRYDDWGIRESWKLPVLMRAACDLQLAPGKQRLMVRGRGLGRLWVNGKLIATTKALKGSTDGHEPVKPLVDAPAPGVRPVCFGNEEVFADIEVGADGKCHVIYEMMCGGKKFRSEPGETCLAIQTADGKSYALVQPGAKTPAPLTDETWEAVAARAEKSLSQLDDATRRKLASSQDEFWNKRHEAAAKWAAANPVAASVSEPGSVHSQPQGNPIDGFISAKIQQALASSAGAGLGEAKKFHDDVLPILRDNCFRCHGEKEKGGLRLNTLEAALKGGKSGDAAVVVGKPDASELIKRIVTEDEDEDDRMPPKEPLKPEQIAALKKWIADGAKWPLPPVSKEEVAQPPAVSDAAFLRRAYLDTVGLPPTEKESREFLADRSADKRAKLVDRLLADERRAENWLGYWQDVLAENPSILKPSLNNSGPFRFYLLEAYRDGKAMDRVVTELVMLRGSEREGGTAGFGMAADNDAPKAQKGQILAGALLGTELQCARCHDSPYHATLQRDLYQLAAMMERKTITVPKTSTVPAGFFEKKGREALIKVTMKPGEPVEPKWPFAKYLGIDDGPEFDALCRNPKDSRERLAALITAPQNTRFANVMVNRIWKRLIGAGFVEPAHDWEGRVISHPELLAWLAHEFVKSGYDARHIERLIMTSKLYEREATGKNLKAPSEKRFFAAPDRRRLAAEQVVDSLFAASGKSLAHASDELTFDPDSRRPADTMVNYGKPCRAWQFTSLSNERDRPSLSLPRAQAVADVLEAFGWTGSRQSPRTDRETDPNILQPGVLANSVMASWITRISADSGLADLAVSARSPAELVDSVFLRFLSREPTSDERKKLSAALASGFAERLIAPADVKQPVPPPRISPVTWSTHLVEEANTIKIEMERRARAGDPADPRLEPKWRETYEDFIWGIINTPEFVWIP